MTSLPLLPVDSKGVETGEDDLPDVMSHLIGDVTDSGVRVTGNREESGDVTAENGDVTAQSGDVTAESGDVTAQSGDVTAQSGDVTAQSGDTSQSVAEEECKVSDYQGSVETLELLISCYSVS